MTNLGLNIKLFRVKAGLTQTQLAQKLKSNPSTVCHYENNRRIPRLLVLTRIAKIFKITIDELIKKTWD